MTPKEKAKELVNKYLQVYDGRVTQAKQCALIAVDEIMKTPLKYGNYKKENQYPQSYWDYWQEVRNEIDKL